MISELKSFEIDFFHALDAKQFDAIHEGLLAP